MFEDYITVEYIENQIEKLNPIISESRLIGKDLENAEIFFIEFIEFMDMNGISAAGCHFYTSILKESLSKQINLVEATKLIKYANIYLSIIKKLKKENP